MNLCPSAIATAAIFTALIINDLINGDYRPIVLHLFGGAFVTLGILTLCQYIGDYAGWIFLAIPVVVILIGTILEWYSSSSTDTVTISSGPSSGPCLMPCSRCGYCNPCHCRPRRPCPPKEIKNPQTTTLGKC